MRRVSHPFIAELKRFVANQNATLGPVVMSLSDMINKNCYNELERVQNLQVRLSEVTDMIHAAHVFHRCVQDHDYTKNQGPQSKIMHQDNIMSLLVGDYLLAQSSVDMADLRYPKTVGLIARGLEDYTRGEFFKLQLFDKCNKSQVNHSEIIDGLERYAKLTCGSLLSNACLSAALLAGYPDRDSENPQDLANLVYKFGFHVGSAHRLIQFLYCPDTNSQEDQKFLSDQKIEVNQFGGSIRCHINKALEVLFCLPDQEKRSSLVLLLNTMWKSHFAQT